MRWLKDENIARLIESKIFGKWRTLACLIEHGLVINTRWIVMLNLLGMDLCILAYWLLLTAIANFIKLRTAFCEAHWLLSLNFLNERFLFWVLLQMIKNFLLGYWCLFVLLSLCINWNDRIVVIIFDQHTSLRQITSFWNRWHCDRNLICNISSLGLLNLICLRVSPLSCEVLQFLRF